MRTEGVCLMRFVIMESNLLEENFPKSNGNLILSFINPRIEVPLKKKTQFKKKASVSAAPIPFG